MSASILRGAHGTGADAILRAESPALDETPTNADDTARGLAVAERRGRPFAPGNRAAEGRRPTLALLGVPLDAADPRCRAALRRADRLRQRRVREQTIASGGYLGAGPCAMLGSSARSLAASVIVYGLAMDAMAAGRTKEASDLFLASSRLADSARQQDLTAVGLAEREAAARTAAMTPEQIQAEIRRRIMGGDK